MSRRWRIGGSLYAGVVLLIGGTTAITMINGRSADGAERHAGVARLVVSNPAGPITVRGGRPALVVHHHAEWTTSRPQLRDRREDTVLIVDASCSRRTGVTISINCSVAYEIEVPDGLDLDLSAGGPITVTGVTGRLTTRASDGG
ncbi:hypothetical protein [Symbioplanes lichenis]|uniref:hypothetical protein n=1 Tax=Symbioplanes lichenis TaxID=1629072 RepID=UPI00273901C2|nr:hypothetical protein [Actinoplanes lichenis]